MFEFIFNKSKMLPIEIRTKLNNLTVTLEAQRSINLQIIKKNAELEARLMKLEKKFILSKIE
jgi:hypothetical protein